MLFLSVILMLPASITLTSNTNSYNYIYILLITELTQNDQAWNVYSVIIIYSLLFIVVWGFFSLCDFSINEVFNAPFGKIPKVLLNVLRSLTSRTAIVYIFTQTKSGIRLVKEFFGIDVPSDTFGAFTKNPANLAALPRFTPVGMFMHDFLFFFYQNIESKLYGPISRNMYKNTLPVWGNLFKILEYGYAPARHISHINWPIPDIRRRYIPARLSYSIHYLFPYLLELPFIRYIFGNGIVQVAINRLIFIINLIYFLIINICYNIYKYLASISNITETVLQICLIVSIFLVANPLTYDSYQFLFINEIICAKVDSLEGLSSIKHILYEENILYLLISVIGLLIALIGSAVFTRHSK